MSNLLPHQIEALQKLRNGNILKGGTGSGKTAVALAYYDDVEDAERLIIITTAMKRDTGDWEAEAREFGIFPEVDSWQNLPKYQDVKGAFFIFDEQRVVGSGAWVQAFLKVTRHNKWILLSATPGDTWMDYIPVMVANGFYKNRTEFLREHVVFSRFVKFPRVERFLATAKLVRLLQNILVEMPYEKHTIRHEIDIYCEYDRELYGTVLKKRWNFMEGRPIRQVSELFSLMRRVVNWDPSRVDNIYKILAEHPRVIIFYNFDYELDILRELDVVQAEWNGHKHEPLPAGNSWVYLVQYQAGAEGWNCTQTDTAIFYSLTYSYRKFEQAKGRIDRLDTPFTDLYYFIFRSPAGIDRAISVSLSDKKDFNEVKCLKSQISTLIS